MVLKTFNVQEETFDKFSKICKENGVSMSKQVEMFMQSFAEQEPEVREEYLKKIDNIKKGKFVKVSDFNKRYGLDK
ncbi:MAG: hypothetical protein ACP5N3_05795 [Candidatus Nanoarchaeia archaeon]